MKQTPREMRFSAVCCFLVAFFLANAASVEVKEKKTFVARCYNYQTNGEKTSEVDTEKLTLECRRQLNLGCVINQGDKQCVFGETYERKQMLYLDKLHKLAEPVLACCKKKGTQTLDAGTMFDREIQGTC